MLSNIVGLEGYSISNKFYATSFLVREEPNSALTFPFQEVEKRLNPAIKSFYESSSPVVDGSILLGKSILLHLLARIAQVFLDVIVGICVIVTGVYYIVTSPWERPRLLTFLEGWRFLGAGLGILTIAPVVDGVLAITSPLEGIYEAGRVFFSRMFPPHQVNV